MVPVPRGFHAWALAVAVLVAVASTWPVATHLYDHVIDGARIISPDHPEQWAPANIGADVLTTTWIVNWMIHALATQPLHPFDANIFYRSARERPTRAPLRDGLLGMRQADRWPRDGASDGAPALPRLSAWRWAYVVARRSESIVGGLVAAIPVRGVAVSPVPDVSPPEPRDVLSVRPVRARALQRDRAPAVGGLAALAVVLQMLSGQYLGYFAIVTAFVCGICSLVAGRAGERRGSVGRVMRDGSPRRASGRGSWRFRSSFPTSVCPGPAKFHGPRLFR
jgi:hypothetical protein